MKRIALFLLCLLLPAPLMANEKIIVESKFIQSDKATIPRDFDRLDKVKGIEILTLPRITTTEGEPGSTEVVQDPPASGFDIQPVGWFVSVTPRAKGKSIAYDARLRVSEVIAGKDSKESVRREVTKRDLYVSGIQKKGEDVWLEFSDPIQGRKTVVWLRFTQHDD